MARSKIDLLVEAEAKLDALQESVGEQLAGGDAPETSPAPQLQGALTNLSGALFAVNAATAAAITQGDFRATAGSGAEELTAQLGGLASVTVEQYDPKALLRTSNQLLDLACSVSGTLEATWVKEPVLGETHELVGRFTTILQEPASWGDLSPEQKAGAQALHHAVRDITNLRRRYRAHALQLDPEASERSTLGRAYAELSALEYHSDLLASFGAVHPALSPDVYESAERVLVEAVARGRSVLPRTGAFEITGYRNSLRDVLDSFVKPRFEPQMGVPPGDPLIRVPEDDDDEDDSSGEVPE